MIRLVSLHTVRVRDVGETDEGRPWMVMEYLEGRDLEAVVATGGPLAADDAIAWMLQVCDAVGEAHSFAIVHRDLKLRNLFLERTPSGTPNIRVLDFGLTAPIPVIPESEARLTKVGGIEGTSHYMAPEQVQGTRVDARTDVWAAGVCFYRLLTNRYPFDGNHLAEVMKRIVSEAPLAVQSSSQTILPPGAEAVIRRCLQKLPRDRFQSMRELAVALTNARDEMRNTPIILATSRPVDIEPESDRTPAVPMSILDHLRVTPHVGVEAVQSPDELERALARAAHHVQVGPTTKIPPTFRGSRALPLPSAVVSVEEEQCDTVREPADTHRDPTNAPPVEQAGGGDAMADTLRDPREPSGVREPSPSMRDWAPTTVDPTDVRATFSREPPETVVKFLRGPGATSPTRDGDEPASPVATTESPSEQPEPIEERGQRVGASAAGAASPSRPSLGEANVAGLPSGFGLSSAASDRMEGFAQLRSRSRTVVLGLALLVVLGIGVLLLARQSSSVLKTPPTTASATVTPIPAGTPPSATTSPSPGASIDPTIEVQGAPTDKLPEPSASEASSAPGASAPSSVSSGAGLESGPVNPRARPTTSRAPGTTGSASEPTPWATSRGGTSLSPRGESPTVPGDSSILNKRK